VCPCNFSNVQRRLVSCLLGRAIALAPAAAAPLSAPAAAAVPAPGRAPGSAPAAAPAISAVTAATAAAEAAPVSAPAAAASTASTAALAAAPHATRPPGAPGLGHVHLDLLAAHSLAVQSLLGGDGLGLVIVGDEGVAFAAVVGVEDLAVLLELCLELLLGGPDGHAVHEELAVLGRLV